MDHSIVWTVDPASFLSKRAHMALSAAGRLKKKIAENPDLPSLALDLEGFAAVPPIHGKEAAEALESLRKAASATDAADAVDRIVQLTRPLAAANRRA